MELLKYHYNDMEITNSFYCFHMMVTYSKKEIHLPDTQGYATLQTEEKNPQVLINAHIHTK